MMSGDSVFMSGGFMWVIWIVILWVVILFLKNTMSSSNDSDSPLQILQKRYARGEIDEQEYKRMRDELKE